MCQEISETRANDIADLGVFKAQNRVAIEHIKGNLLSIEMALEMVPAEASHLDARKENEGGTNNLTSRILNKL